MKRGSSHPRRWKSCRGPKVSGQYRFWYRDKAGKVQTREIWYFRGEGEMDDLLAEFDLLAVSPYPIPGSRPEEWPRIIEDEACIGDVFAAVITRAKKDYKLTGKRTDLERQMAAEFLGSFEAGRAWMKVADHQMALKSKRKKKGTEEDGE